MLMVLIGEMFRLPAHLTVWINNNDNQRAITCSVSDSVGPVLESKKSESQLQ